MGYPFIYYCVWKIRKDTIWNQTKDVIAKKGLPLVFDIVKSVSTEIMTEVVKDFVGV